MLITEQSHDCHKEQPFQSTFTEWQKECQNILHSCAFISVWPLFSLWLLLMEQRNKERFSQHPRSIAAKALAQSISPSALSSSALMKDRRKRVPQGGSLHQLLPPLLFSGLISLGAASRLTGMEYDYGFYPKMVCAPIPANADPGCFSGRETNDHGPHRPGGGGSRGHSWWGLTDDAKATILHLRETLVQQKETILDQRETIRELTAKLTLCEGFGRSVGGQNGLYGQFYPHRPPLHHPYPDPSHHADPHYPLVGRRDLHHPGTGALGEGDSHSSPEQVGRMLLALKERLENLQSRNSSSSYSHSLRDLLRRKINALEQQLRHHPALHGNKDHHDDHHSDHDDDEDHDHNNDHDHNRDHDHAHSHHNHPHEYSRHENHYLEHHYDDHHDDDHHDNESDGHGHSPRKAYHRQGHRATSRGLDSLLSQLQHRSADSGTWKKSKSEESFQIGFPMRTNYMYARVKRSLLNEIFALTLCLWIKGGSGPGLGTPFSYSVPGQANELVLIEWGNNPMELLVNDKAVTLPLSLSDGKWHHLCVTWSTRAGQWEAYQDGLKRGSGENLATWHHIKPGGVIILGQEQDTLGGRFDATQAFVGEMSDLQLWSQVLTPQEIYRLGTCRSHMTGDILSWTESLVELHGGVKYPFEPCH